MKKKIFSLFVLLIMICSLTGCIKYNATMEIGKDKSMNFSIIYAMDNSFLEMSDDKENAILDAKEKQSLINQGFIVDDYKDDKYTGFSISKKYLNIDDISSETDTEYSLSNIFKETSNSKLFKVVKGTDKNTYYANFKFDSSDAEEESTENNSSTTLGDSLTSSMDLKFIVKLPIAPISSNANETSEDGKELTWKLTTKGQETINFQFELDNISEELITSDTNNNKKNEFITRIFSKSNMPVIIGAGIIFLVAVIVVIGIYIKANKENKKRTNKKNENKIESEQTSGVSTPDTSVNSVEPVQSVAQTAPVVEPQITVETAKSEQTSGVSTPDTSVNSVEPVQSVEQTAPVVEPQITVETAKSEVSPEIAMPDTSVNSVEPVQSVAQTAPVVEPQTTVETAKPEPVAQLNSEEQANEENDDNLTII